MQATSVLEAFLELVHQDPEVAVVMEKRHGLWQRRTRRQLAEQISVVARGLVEQGLGAGDTVMIAAADHAEWLVMDLAVQATGARVCAVTPDVPDDVLLRVASEAGATIVVVSGQSSSDRLLELIGSGGTRLGSVIDVAPAGPTSSSDPRVTPLSVIEERGAAAAGDADWLRARAFALDAAGAAVFAVSSGVVTTRHSVVLTHGALFAGAQAVVAAAELDERDRVFAFRPLADPTERTTTIYSSLLAGALLALAETRAQVADAMYEVAPTYVHVTRRWLDQTASGVVSRLAANRGLKKMISRRWVRDVSQGTGDAPAGPLIRYSVVEKLGLDKARTIVVSGSPLGASERRFAAALGLPVRPAYSLTEAGGIVTLASSLPEVSGACGDALPGVGIQIDPTGKVVVAGPSIAGGRVETGDMGDHDGDQLILHGREDARIRVGAERIPSLPLETTLRRSPHIREAVVEEEDGRVVLTLELVEEAVTRWATDRGITFATFRALSEMDEVAEFVRATVEPLAAEGGLERIDEIRVLPVPLEAVPGALSPSGRLRRETVTAFAAERRAGTAGTTTG